MSSANPTVVSRDCYVITNTAEHRDLGWLCAMVFDTLDDIATTARVDAYSDYSDQMPDDVANAEDWLRHRGLACDAGDPGLHVAIDRSDGIGWDIARAYAPWATRITLRDATGETVATIDDGGHLVTLWLDDARAKAFRDALGSKDSLVPIAQLTAHEHNDDERRSTSGRRLRFRRTSV